MATPMPMAKAVGVAIVKRQNTMAYTAAMLVVVVVVTVVVMAMMMVMTMMMVMMMMMFALRVGHDRGSQRKRCGGCHNQRSMANQVEQIRHSTRSVMKAEKPLDGWSGVFPERARHEPTSVWSQLPATRFMRQLILSTALRHARCPHPRAEPPRSQPVTAPTAQASLTG
jgi:hypothetical protein